MELPASEYQKIALYILPVQDSVNSIAEYLSFKDLWYRRYVYNIFREKMLFPYVSMEDPEFKDSFPNYLYNRTIQMYIREGHRKVPFQIFQCDIST
jgi:hypothetical protein